MTIDQDITNFLSNFVDFEGRYVYQDLLSRHWSVGEYFNIDFYDILLFEDEQDTSDLQNTLMLNPDAVIKAFRRIITSEIGVSIEVGIKRPMTLISPENIRVEHENQLVRMDVMVIQRSIPETMTISIDFKCSRGHVIPSVIQPYGRYVTPANCTDTMCRSKTFSILSEEKIDYQRIKVQGQNTATGGTPVSLSCHLYHSNVNKVAPGDSVTLSGIFREVPRKLQKGKQTTYDRFLEVLHISSSKSEISISDDDIQKIREMISRPRYYENLTSYIAPHILGYSTEKEAILYYLVGGVEKSLNGSRLRGSLNIMLVGDPGTGKSQILSSVLNLARKAIYSNGRGSSAAGITAGVTKDERGVMTLEAGALVLADQGYLLIDEFDKMDPRDVSALHESMEIGTVSISKAGIQARLNARASLLVAANPKNSIWDPELTLVDQVNMPASLISRFDLIFVFEDQRDEDTDLIVANKVFENRSETKDVDIEFLQKLVQEASRCEPKFSPAAKDLLISYYTDLRSSDAVVTVRQLESLSRIAEARAKLRFDTVVRPEDAERAIEIMRHSMAKIAITEDGSWDMDLLETGRSRKQNSMFSKAIAAYNALGAEFTFSEYLAEMKNHMVSEKYSTDLLSKYKREGRVMYSKGRYVKT